MSNTTKNFFEDQSDQTAAKIYFFEKYITKYLIKILMFYRQCVVIDLFCGCGKNGVKDGSPLVLLNRLKYILQIDGLSNVVVNIIFNDYDNENINKLKKETENHINKNIKIHYFCKNYTDIIKEVFKLNQKIPDIPKFIFLDPYTYSQIPLSDIKELMDKENTEILLFTPTFQVYRFITGEKPPKKLISFVDDYTDKGVIDYNGISDFVLSIKNKIENSIEGSYVRPLIIESEHSKNTLFLITKSIVGMAAFNDLVWNTTQEKWGINLNKIKKQNKNQLSIVNAENIRTKYDDELKRLLIEKIKLNEGISNIEIIKFVAQNLFRLTHAKKELKKMIGKEINVTYSNNVKRKGELYINLNNINRKMTTFNSLS